MRRWVWSAAVAAMLFGAAAAAKDPAKPGECTKHCAAMAKDCTSACKEGRARAGKRDTSGCAKGCEQVGKTCDKECGKDKKK